MSIKKSISLLGYIWSYGFLILIIFTFACAFINPSKTILVSINSYNEQYIEIGFLIIVFIISTCGLYFMIKEYRHNVNM